MMKWEPKFILALVGVLSLTMPTASYGRSRSSQSQSRSCQSVFGQSRVSSFNSCGIGFNRVSNNFPDLFNAAATGGFSSRFNPSGFSQLGQFGQFGSQFGQFGSQFGQFGQFSRFNSNGFAGNSRFLNSGFGNQFSRFGNSQFGNQFGNFNRFSNIEFFNNFKEVAGFNKFVQVGNRFVGQGSAGQHFSVFIDRFGNLIDRNGRQVRDFEPETVRQLKDFYLKNRDKFSGNDLAQVDRFLSANGGFGNGKLSIDLNAFSMPSKRDDKTFEITDPDFAFNQDRVDAALAALNFTLNTIQSRCAVKITKNSVQGGIATFDLTRFRDANGNLCFNGEVLGFMQNSDGNAACNSGRIRINEFLHTLNDPDIYYRGQGLNNLNRTQVSQVLGMQEDKRNSFNNKLLVGYNDETGRKESGVVGGDQRVLERQSMGNVPGRWCYRSLDFLDIHRGGSETASRSVVKNGILFTHDAEEWICMGANGFLFTLLFNQEGKLLPDAPASIAVNGRAGSPAIRSPMACLDCHNQGFIGGGQNPEYKYTEQKFKIENLNEPTLFTNPFTGQRLTHGDYFVTNGTYSSWAAADSKIFQDAQAATGSVFEKDGKRLALVPGAIRTRTEPVYPEIAARELGISLEAAKALVGGKAIPRTDFESKYCNLRRGSNSSLNESNQRFLSGKEAVDGRIRATGAHSATPGQ